MHVYASHAKRLRSRALLLVALGLAVTPLAAQRPLNLDFDRASVAYSDRPWGWTLGWSAFTSGTSARFTLDSAQRRDGARSLRIDVDDDPTAPDRQLMLQLPADGLRGKRLRLEGHIRSALTNGRASVTLEAWGDSVMPAADTARVATGSSEGWQPFAIEIHTPPDPSIHSIVLQVGAQGRGRAWFDAFVLRVDGRAITVSPARDVTPTRAELASLATHATPLRRVALAEGADSGDDLEAFDRIVGNARLVALGESTHGTREFFQAKHRLLAHLVRTQGFDVFAIEANQLAVERLNAYVMGGPGTVEDAMRVLFRVWYTEEMRALVAWMRTWNGAHPARPVRFVGYDMQDHQRPVDSLQAIVGALEPALSPRVEQLTREYRAQRSFATPQVGEPERAHWKEMAESLVTVVSSRRTTWLEAARSARDSVRIEWAVQSANLFRQAARLNATLHSPDRDSLMAANLDWAMSTLYPRSRAVVWAHDVHVSHGGDPARSFNGGAQMGAYLRRSHGDAYRALSLLTHSGMYTATRSFTDHEMVAVQAFAAPAGSIEGVLAALPRPANAPGLIVPLRPKSADWLRTLREPRPVRHIGYAAYDYGFEMRAIATLEFDGIVFIERTTASRLLP